jgi:hypothetical protein
MEEYDDYAEIQFVERNARDDDRRHPQGRHPARRPGHRTFVPMHRQPHPQPQVIYAQGPGLGVGLGGSSLFGRVTTGQLIDMVAQIFAALMPLPAAPNTTNETATDVANLILYQGSLAQYAKRDEQVRTLGNLITKLVG